MQEELEREGGRFGCRVRTGPRWSKRDAEAHRLIRLLRLLHLLQYPLPVASSAPFTAAAATAESHGKAKMSRGR